MQTTQNTVVETTRSLTNKELIAMVLDLESRIKILESQPTAKAPAEGKEMSDDEARRIMNGDLKDKKHKECAETLGLTYGQIYSCRLGYTFKTIHKELAAVEGYKNQWVK
jgi:hypothetical protein